MANFGKDVAFSGIEEFFPEDLRPAVAELARRLERFSNSLTYKLRGQVTVFRNEADDTPVGMKEGDLWATPTNYFYRFDGLQWVQLVP